MKRQFDDPVYARWRKAVYERDGYRCRMPNCSCGNRPKRKGLNAHHIQKWANASALRYEVSNGITLCYVAHKSISGKEHLYVSLFMSIIQSKL